MSFFKSVVVKLPFYQTSVFRKKIYPLVNSENSSGQNLVGNNNNNNKNNNKSKLSKNTKLGYFIRIHPMPDQTLKNLRHQREATRSSSFFSIASLFKLGTSL